MTGFQPKRGLLPTPSKFAALVLLGWLLAACGGGSAAPSATNTTSPTAVGEATLAPTPTRTQAEATPASTLAATATAAPIPPSPTATEAASATGPGSGAAAGNAETSGPATQAELAAAIAASRNAKRDVTYCTVDGVDLKMDIYLPKNGTLPTPLAVFIHGGGWTEGDKRGGDGYHDFAALLEAGYSVASLNYRLAPDYTFPAMIDDVKCAIRSFRANAKDYGIDPNRIGVWGISAGSHLGLLIALTDPSAGFDVGQYLDQSSRIEAMVDMSGPSDLTVDFSPIATAKKGVAFGSFDLAKASPITYVSSAAPPILIFQGEKDTVVPLNSGQAQELYDKLTAVGATTQMVVVKGGPHLLTAPDQTPTRAEITQMLVDWFDKYVK